MEKSIEKIDIKEFSKNQLVDWLKNHKMPSYRADQIFKWVYLKQVDSFTAMTDISKDNREFFNSQFTISRLEKIKVASSEDNTKKYLFRLGDGKLIESVLIPENDYCTICVSTQVGCAQDCKFCLTAKGGFIRNLSPGEIISQIRDIKNEIALINPEAPLTNIVFMGMGEPLANFKNLIHALGIITDGDYGLKFSHRRVTISTAGLVPNLQKLGEATKSNLAISLNATNNKTRDFLMPINKKYPIEKLLEACAKYATLNRRKVTYEYILIKGINDSMDDAKRLSRMLSFRNAKINLIPFNEHDGVDFRRPDDPTIHNFLKYLQSKNFVVTTRVSRGKDISAACGQLSANAKSLQTEIK